MDWTCLIYKNEDITSLLWNNWIIELHVLTVPNDTVNIILIFWNVSWGLWININTFFGCLFILENSEVFCPFEKFQLKFKCAHHIIICTFNTDVNSTVLATTSNIVASEITVWV